MALLGFSGWFCGARLACFRFGMLWVDVLRVWVGFGLEFRIPGRTLGVGFRGGFACFVCLWISLCWWFWVFLWVLVGRLMMGFGVYVFDVWLLT